MIHNIKRLKEQKFTGVAYGIEPFFQKYSYERDFLEIDWIFDTIKEANSYLRRLNSKLVYEKIPKELRKELEGDILYYEVKKYYFLNGDIEISENTGWERSFYLIQGGA